MIERYGMTYRPILTAADGVAAVVNSMRNQVSLYPHASNDVLCRIPAE